MPWLRQKVLVEKPFEIEWTILLSVYLLLFQWQLYAMHVIGAQ